jgi:hypothetical protein
MAGGTELDSGQGEAIFFFSTASRLAPGHVHYRIQWYRRALYLVKLPEREADQSLSSSEVKNA